MSSMEDILATQEQLVGAINQLYSNFKKDSSDRKTREYLRRKLEILDQYWKEFHSNHVSLLSFGDKSHEYFSGQYEQAKEAYTIIRDKIRSQQPMDRPETPVLKPPTFVPGTSASGSHTSNQGPEKLSAGTNSKTEDMLKKQGSNFRAFMRTASNIDLDTVSEKWEFDDLLHILQARWSAIDKLHWELDSELNGSHQEYEQQFSNYESHYAKIKKAINKKMWSVAHREKYTPTVEIPTFNGSYTQWVPFKDLFTETVHNNPSLSNAQKMQFLKGKVKGDAEKLIQHLQISSDNYLICWEILNHRYNNKRQIFMSHANTIMNIPVMQHQAVNHIKRIHDTAYECLNAIKNLGVDISTWDPLLVYLLSQKLDSETYNDYMECMKQPRELPKLEEFLKFLETKFTTLESSRRKQDYSTQKSSQNNNQGQSSRYQESKQHQNPNFYKHSFTSSARVKTNANSRKENSVIRFKCPICKDNDHGIYFCKKFGEMPPSIKLENVSRLNLCQNCLFDHNGKACISNKRCRECNKDHNSMLHNAFTSGNPKPDAKSDGQSSSPPKTPQMKSNAHVSHNNPSEILLATAIIKVQAADGSTHVMRALLDQGSQTSLITENAAQILRLPRQKCLGVISGIGAKESNCKGMVTITCTSTVSDFTFDTETFIIKNLIKNLPSSTFPKPDWSYLDHIKLADPEFYSSRPVDILLGADIYSNILMDGICRANQTLPTAQQTQLGWILSGNVKTYHCNVILNNLEQIQQFWEIEDITESADLSLEDQQCMEIYRSTTKRRDDGRYEVKLPLKPNFETILGESKSKSIAQFFQLERKLNRQSDIAKEYKSFMNEYLSLGHMIPADSNRNSKREFYLPHHCVHRQESTTTKLRVVFNGSANTSTGHSLNDAMCRGPNLQQDLQNLIIKWRQYRFALTADIEKMFRQIRVDSADQALQKIIWRDEQTQVLQEYQLTTVTYGTKAAPFLAMMTLKQLALDERTNYQDSPAPEVLEQSFYMDDLLHGAHSAAAAKKLIQDLTSLLKSGGFNLRKWKSNLSELLSKEVQNEPDDQNHFDFKQAESTKTLGLKWDPKEDTFIFQPVTFSSTSKVTKRSLLSDISKVYDPLGWLAPFTTKLKIIFQDVWRAGIEWEDPVPHNVLVEWEKVKDDIKVLDILWWDGPEWLPMYVPTENNQNYVTNQEVRQKSKQVAVTQTPGSNGLVDELLIKYSSLNKAIRVLGWVIRFIKRKEQQGYLSIEELKYSRKIIISHVQQGTFSTEIERLKDGKTVNGKSKIISLNPILDQDELLRVGGTLRHANLDPDIKNPIIIPSHTRLADLIIDQSHELTFHGGAKQTTAFTRQKYWLLGGNRATKKRLRNCVTCKRHNPNQHHHLMGDLPSARITPSRVFYHAGVDFTGHVAIKASKGRGIKTTKGYVAVFVCMATKAVHLELVSDLTTSAFLAALHRMAARRGVPGHIYSDQGTNFIGANKVLKEELAELQNIFNDDFMREITEMQIKWHHNAPSWPSAGGLWEAAVKSLKYHIKRVIGEQKLTYEEYITVLARLEACLNSRPLCPLTEDPTDLDFLTPSHFLASGPTLTLYDTEKDQRTRWHLTQKIFKDIWDRWQREYLTQLSARSKWRQPQKNININDVVIINDANLPPGKWGLGRVVELHPGSDGYVRVVTLKTKNGLIKRPIIKLSILPVQQEIQENKQEQQNLTLSSSLTPHQDEQNIKNKSSNKRKQISLSSLAMSLLLFFITIIPTTKGDFNLTSLQNNNSLYFDSITNMHIIRDDWRLIVYYDTYPYHEGKAALDKYIEYLERARAKIRIQSHCDGIMLQLRHGFEELLRYDSLLMNHPTGARRRRGLIDGVGYLLNSFFGVLDAHFAEKYVKDINLIKANENHLAALWKNQTSVVEAEFNLLKRSESIMERHHKLVNQKIMSIVTSLDELNSGIQNVSLITDFITTSIVANNILNNLKSMQEMLLDTVTNIFNGKITFHLLTPDQLRHQLNIISRQLPKELSLPIDNTLAEIYNLLKVRARMTEKFLIIEIKIPLVGRDMYEVLRLVPVPHLTSINSSKSVSVIPVSEYAAINIKKDSLISLTESDLRSCLRQNYDIMLCHIKKPIFHIKDDHSLCQTLPNSRECKSIIKTCQNAWIELHKVNYYLFFCCAHCQLKLLCEDQITVVQLTRKGILHVNQGCIIKSADFLVYAHKQEISQFTIRSKIDAPEISPINNIINVSIPTSLNMSEVDSVANQRQLEVIGERLESIKKEEPLINSVSYHDVHHYAAIYTILSIVVLCAIIYTCKKKRCFRRLAEVTSEAERSQPAARGLSLSLSGSAQHVQCIKCVCDQTKCSASEVLPNEHSEVITSAQVSKRNQSTSPVLRSVFSISDA